MKSFIKNNIKFFIGIIIGSVFTGSIAYAAIIASSDQVSFTPSTENSNWNVDNVKDALDDLYENGQNNYYTGVNDTKVGTATADKVLKDYTFTNSTSVGATGSMPNNGAKDYSGTSNTKIAAGYHNGSGYCKLGDAYTAGVNSVSLSGNADTGNVLSGKTFYKDSTTKLTGTMTDRGAANYSGTSNTNIAAGYHNGSGVCKLGDAYTAGRNSVSLSGNAETSHVLSGKTFYKDSTTKLTGTMTDKGATNYTGTSNTTIAAGYYNGSGQCKLGDAYTSGYNARSANPALTWTYNFTSSIPKSGSGNNYADFDFASSGCNTSKHKILMVYVTQLKWNNSYSGGIFYYSGSDLSLMNSNMVDSNFSKISVTYVNNCKVRFTNLSTNNAITALSFDVFWIKG